MYRIQVRQDHANGAWYWRIVSRNGQVILTSETYAKRGNAERAAERFWLNHCGELHLVLGTP